MVGWRRTDFRYCAYGHAPLVLETAPRDTRKRAGTGRKAGTSTQEAIRRGHFFSTDKPTRLKRNYVCRSARGQTIRADSFDGGRRVDRDALPQRGGDARQVHRARAGRGRQRRLVGRDHRRRQRQHRWIAEHRPEARRQSRRRVEKGLRQRPHRRHRRGARPLRGHGRRRRQLRLRGHRPADRQAARGLRPGGWESLPRRHRARRDAVVASLGGEPGADVHQPRLLPRAGGRHALRLARLQEGRVRKDAPARHRDGVRERDGDQGCAEGHAHHRGGGRPASRRPLASTSPADVARRLAPPALHAPVQPALALPVSRPGAVRVRGNALRAPGRGAAPCRERATRHPHAAGGRLPHP